MNVERLERLIQQRKVKQYQVRSAMDRHDFNGMLARIRERAEIDKKISEERKRGTRVLYCKSNLKAF